MEILKKGSIERALEFDEKNDIKVRFECERCGCEFVASALASECKETLACDPEASTRWYGDCPECGHGCFSDDEVIGDDMNGIKVCGLCKHFDRFEIDSTRGSCRNNKKFGVLCTGEHACDSFKRDVRTNDCWRGECDPKSY